MPCSVSKELPLLLRLDDRPVVIVGGGRAGLRKLATLIETGTRIRVISGRAGSGDYPPEVEIVRRDFRPEDLDDAQLAFAATDDEAVNAAVVAAAHERGLLCARADVPELGDFALPAVRRRGSLTIAVATGGASPTLAALLADELAAGFGPEWETVVEIAAILRRRRLTPEAKIPYNREVLRQLLAAGLAEQLRTGDVEAVERILLRICGSDCTLDNLGIQLPKAKP